MKRITFVLIMMLVTGYAFSQSTVLQSSEIGGRINSPVHYSPSGAKVIDTVFIDEFFANLTNAYNYVAPGFGYIFGPHWDTAGAPRSEEQAQGYLNIGSGYYVIGAAIWTSIKAQTSVNGSELYVRVVPRDDSSSYIIGGITYDIACPGTTVIAADTIAWNDIDTSSTGFTTANFSVPGWIPAAQDYCVVYNVSDFYANGDTVSIIGGDPVATQTYGLEYTYYLYPNPELWAQFSHLWSSGGNPIEAAIAIFPIVDDEGGVVSSDDFINYMQLSQNYPNPSPDGITTIRYAIQNESNVILEVYDSKGNKVEVWEQGCQPAGTYSISLNKKLSSGIYLYSLVANGHRLTKRMCID